ncbi:MAG: ABC transporter ATP-binding protein [Clostridia bacterium]|nr:ABC transporter ATP-binding protein [Clostridia bacterium]
MAKVNVEPKMKGPGSRGARILEKPKDFKGTLKFLWSYLKAKRVLLFFVSLLILVNIFASLAGTNYLEPIINNFLQPINNNLTIAERLAGLTHGVMVLIGIYLISVVAAYLQSRLMIYSTQKIMNNIRGDLFNHIQTLPVKFFDTHTHGEVMSRFTNDVDTLNEALNNSLTALLSSVITLAGTLFLMFSKSIPLTIVELLMTPIMFTIVGKITKRSSKYFVEQQSNLGKVNGYIEEIMTGEKVVKVFCHEQIAIDTFDELNENLRLSATHAQSFAGMLMPILMNTNNTIYALISMFGGLLAVMGYINVGELVVFLTLTKQFARPINEAANQFNSVITAMAGAERIYEVMKEEPEKMDLPNSAKLVKEGKEFFWQKYDENGNPSEKIPLKGDVRFFDVTFGYNDEKIVLNNISLYAKPGQKIAFVGSTGAGKTTIINLITRFYDNYTGTITFDSIDVKNIEKGSLRHALSVVLQDTHLFTGTVRENIRYGRLDATDEEVIEAAKLASAHSFINRLPHGYDTIIEGDGANLSQGQRQLLNIARAAIADAPILILDEATSSVDTRTERHIEHGLDRLMNNRTTFVIAHRLSTVRNSKAIMVLEHGQIIERGTHEDLLKEKGRYYELYTGAVELD